MNFFQDLPPHSRTSTIFITLFIMLFFILFIYPKALTRSSVSVCRIQGSDILHYHSVKILIHMDIFFLFAITKKLGWLWAKQFTLRRKLSDMVSGFLAYRLYVGDQNSLPTAHEILSMEEKKTTFLWNCSLN